MWSLPPSHGKRLLLEEESQIPGQRVIFVPVEKQNVPEVEFWNPVIHNWWYQTGESLTFQTVTIFRRIWFIEKFMLKP